jgi:hypothetical protein
MQVIDTYAPFSGRTQETPEWCYSHTLLREVLLRYLEDRADCGKNKHAGQPRARLRRVMRKLSARRKWLEKIKAQPNAIEKQNIESQIRLAGTEHKLAIGVIWHYWRLGKDSVATGQALAIQPCHVRQILWRLNRSYERVLASQREWRGTKLCINVNRQGAWGWRNKNYRADRSFRVLKLLAAGNGEVLPTRTWMDKHGFFGDYDVCRMAGTLSQFKREIAQGGNRKKRP